jgi:hypothetical protein
MDTLSLKGWRLFAECGIWHKASRICRPNVLIGRLPYSVNESKVAVTSLNIYRRVYIIATDPEKVIKF